MHKVKCVWCIWTNYGYGWECESEYDKGDYKEPKRTAYSDANEYRKLGCQVEVRRKVVPLV